jgi:hypothetical protein
VSTTQAATGSVISISGMIPPVGITPTCYRQRKQDAWRRTLLHCPYGSDSTTIASNRDQLTYPTRCPTHSSDLFVACPRTRTTAPSKRDSLDRNVMPLARCIVSNLQRLTTLASVFVRTHGNATIGVKVVPASRGVGGMGAGTCSLGKSGPTIRRVKGHLHTKCPELTHLTGPPFTGGPVFH